MAHKWARWLHNPCRLGGPHRFRAGGQNQKWPTSGQGGYIAPAASRAPPPRWSPQPRCTRQNQRCPTSGQGGYINPAASGVPTASERGAESEVAHKWARWLHNPCRLGVPTASERRAQSEVAHRWARWLHNPCRLRAPHRFRAGGRIRGGPQVG